MKAPLSFIFIFWFLFQSNVHAMDRIATDSIIVNDSSIAEEDSSRSHIKLFENSPVPDKSRTRLLMCTTIGLYPVSMYWLYTQWYQDYPQSGFHFFNDNAEWEKMDKFGHAWDAYSISKPLMKCFRWSGYSNTKSTLLASGISFLYQTTVEVFDGFSEEWGFSSGDIICNTAGVGLFAAQQVGWEEQRIVLKYSFHQTKYSRYRPQLLGSNLPENILKDYNGLTYWASINPASFFKNKTWIPNWISLGIGFGAEGMTGGKENPEYVDGKMIPSFERYRQYYLGLDIDLARVQMKSKVLTSIFKFINIVHLPAPAIEFGKGRKARYHAFYF
ncbi:MAG: DUF2279 domain-containing protein [Bacteroidetes bacterium]|nr:DUF2279 domain-containing protein [Bacteroidota bacterium]MBP6403424.1 DUF2279 domain-containing protein [Bacteroidia bacterium]